MEGAGEELWNEWEVIGKTDGYVRPGVVGPGRVPRVVCCFARVFLHPLFVSRFLFCPFCLLFAWVVARVTRLFFARVVCRSLLFRRFLLHPFLFSSCDFIARGFCLPGDCSPGVCFARLFVSPGVCSSVCFCRPGSFCPCVCFGRCFCSPGFLFACVLLC